MASKRNSRGKRPPLNRPEELVKWAGTRDIEKISNMVEIDIHHWYRPESNLPGMTALANNRPSIYINDAYFDNIRKRNPAYTEEQMNDDKAQVLAHELGHACRHREILRLAPIQEYQIFDVHTTLEVEANEYAAAILIDKDDMLSYLNSDLSILQVACAMHVNVNLLIYRIEMLRKEGYSFHELPYVPKNNFMGHVSGAGSSEWDD